MIPVIWPMCASDDEDRIELAFDNPQYVGQRKYDGCRYLIRKENGKVNVVSRQEEKINGVGTGKPVDKTENVPHLVEYFSKYPDETVFDGEIITHENCQSNDVMRIMGCEPAKAIQRQKESGWVKYVVFDILYYAGKNLMGERFIDRHEMLKNVIEENEYVFTSKLYPSNKREVYDEIVKTGGEGIILKNIDAIYQPDKRPLDAWLKKKKYITRDVVIIGYTTANRDYDGKDPNTWPYWFNPTTNEKVLINFNEAKSYKKNGFIPVKKPWFYNQIGGIEIGQYIDGVLTSVGDVSGTSLNDETRRWFTEHQQEALGKVIEIGAMEQIKKTKKFRHSRYLQMREDKNPESCIYGDC